MKILLIDDDPDLVILASFALETLGGCLVSSSSGGLDAVNQAVRERPDVILLDLQMREIDGDQLFPHFRRQPELDGTPIVFLTGKDTEDEWHRLQELGAAGVIVKPFDPARLIEQVKGFLR